MKYLLISVVAAIALFSCKRENQDETATFVYDQTQCSDAWVNSSNDSITVHNVYQYLDSMHVYGPELHVWIKNEGTNVVCQACSCPTGKKIYVSILFPKDVEEKLIALGFRRI